MFFLGTNVLTVNGGNSNCEFTTLTPTAVSIDVDVVFVGADDENVKVVFLKDGVGTLESDDDGGRNSRAVGCSIEQRISVPLLGDFFNRNFGATVVVVVAIAIVVVAVAGGIVVPVVFDK